MRCEECSMLLDDYVEHELNAKDSTQVAAHLAACATCARNYQELMREQNDYAQYLLGVEATPALWNNLQARIEDEKSVRALPLLPRLRNRAASVFSVPQLRPAHVAAVLLVAIIAFIGLIKYKTPLETPKHDVVSSQSNGSSSRVQPLPHQDSAAAALNHTRDSGSENNFNKRAFKNRIDSTEKRAGKSHLSLTALDRTPRVVVPEPVLYSREEGRNAKEQLMLALRITRTQLYVAQKTIQEEQRRTRPATPVSEPNREMR